MKGRVVFAWLCSATFALPADASYYETWTVEGEVVEVYGRKETEKVLEKNKDLVAYRVFSTPNGEKVVEYCRGKDAGKHTKRDKDLKLASTFAGLKIQITKVERKGGHGAMRKPKMGRNIDMILNYDVMKVKGNFEKGMALKMRYEYANGLTPKGVEHSDNWYLIEIVEK